MPSDFLQKLPEETTEAVYADKWLQRILTYLGLPSGILSLLFNQTYLAIICFLWLAVAIGYAFVKKTRKEKHQVIGLEIDNNFLRLQDTIVKPFEREKQELKKPIIDQAAEIKPRSLAIERHNLAATLVVDAVNTRKIDFHIEIENKGSVAATNIKVGFNTKEFTDIEITPDITRLLRIGGKLSVTTAPGVLKPKKTTSLIVKIFYGVVLNGVEKNILQTTRFFIRPADLKVQTIYPEALEENEIDSSIGQDLTPALVQFRESEGTLVFVLPEIGDNGNPNMIQFGNEFRSFTFDVIARIVTFKLKTISERLISLDLPLMKNENGIHLIMLTWDYSKGGILGLDSIEKEDMRENVT